MRWYWFLFVCTRRKNKYLRNRKVSYIQDTQGKPFPPICLQRQKRKVCLLLTTTTTWKKWQNKQTVYSNYLGKWYSMPHLLWSTWDWIYLETYTRFTSIIFAFYMNWIENILTWLPLPVLPVCSSSILSGFKSLRLDGPPSAVSANLLVWATFSITVTPFELAPGFFPPAAFFARSRIT